MKTILICNQKGGVGKSLLADELAFAFERDGIGVSFYNLDPQGGTIHASHENPKDKVAVVDTPGVLTDDLAKWLKQVDIVVIPTRPTSRDIETLLRMKEIISNKAKDVPVVYVINAWNRWKASKDFRDWLANEVGEEAIMIVPQSEAFVQASAARKSVIDCFPDSPAATAIKNFYEHMLKLVKE